MPKQVSFKQPVQGSHVRGTLSLPVDAQEAVPTVLICDGVEAESAPMDDLWEALTDSLTQQGIAVARFVPRCTELIHDDFHAYAAEDHLADLTAAFEWLGSHHAVAERHVGLVGYGIGGATAACLAKQSKRIERLCLLNAAIAANGSAANSSTNGTARHDRTKTTANGAASADSTVTIDHEPPRAYLQTLNELGPLQHLSRYSRPVLLLHCAADRIVEPENLFAWSDAAQSGSAPCEPCLIARADHHFDHPQLRTACIDRMVRFFANLHPAGRSRKRR